MKISEEIKKLKKKIKPLIDDHVQSLIIGFEFDSSNKEWQVIPQYEGGGDGYATYLEMEGSPDRVLQGNGKTLPGAIKDLNKKLDRIIKEDILLFRWH